MKVSTSDGPDGVEAAASSCALTWRLSDARSVSAVAVENFMMAEVARPELFLWGQVLLLYIVRPAMGESSLAVVDERKV